MTETDVEIGMCWFDEEQWKLLAELDPDGTDDSYEEWRREATKAVDNIRSQGHKVTKVAIRTHEFSAWCKEKALEPNSSARAEYASLLLRVKRESEKT